MSWIIHSVSPDIKSSIMFLNSAAAMWVELNNRFNQGNGPRLFELRQTLIRLHQGDDSVSFYFTKLKAIWDEINEICPRTPCTCAAAADNLDSHNQEQLLQFLTGLNESYHAVRAQVLLIDPLPSLSKVFSMIILEERQRNLGPSTNPNIIATSTSNHIPVQYSPTNQNPNPPPPNHLPPRAKKLRPTCTHCQKLGHLKEKCYFLHGFPPGYGSQRKPAPSPQLHHSQNTHHPTDLLFTKLLPPTRMPMSPPLMPPFKD
ncbi:uncharacterized protein LOC133814354 [Humulus lupulus]|uniref:uncharacterized protein LOC133814354 n=1 Tax=Humulus lupulus TaxID=3486 RepID=UPI002B405EB3|nr:uncharacterized protein LOC133814354 [Humulus lupulus]